MTYLLIITILLLVALFTITNSEEKRCRAFRKNVKVGDSVHIYFGGKFLPRTIKGMTQMSLGNNGKTISKVGVRVLDETERKTVVVPINDVFPDR